MKAIENKLRLQTLRSQGLATQCPFGKGKMAVKRAIEHLGYIQIDTLSVIERAHHHTLWNRIPQYQKQYLQELLQDRVIFEYWYHAASYLPISDYRFSLPQMSAIKRGEWSYYGDVERKYIEHVLERLQIDGPLKARDFETTAKKKGTWWNWKPTKRALETLFMQGDIMVSARDEMEKVYDLRERVLPTTVNTKEPSICEVVDHLITRTIQAHGIATVKQMTHLKNNSIRKMLIQRLQERVEERELITIALPGMDIFYSTDEIMNSSVRKTTSYIRLLSPFDNALIHRDRLLNLFKFQYKLECYTPKSKRMVGYFSLPILYNDTFIGRVDCKAHRKEKTFELVHLSLEDSFIPLEKYIHEFVKEVVRFTHFNNCVRVKVSNVTPRNVKKIVEKEIETCL